MQRRALAGLDPTFVVEDEGRAHVHETKYTVDSVGNELLLYRDTVPRPDASCHERTRNSACALDEIAIGDDPPRRRLDERPVGGGHAGGELCEKIGWHELCLRSVFLCSVADGHERA